MAQIIRITSEALQATVRRLLPSQQGFGEDLQASNVIQPIIDLTPSAEGSDVPQYLQTALSFDSQTSFNVQDSNSDLVTGGGFYRITGSATVRNRNGADQQAKIRLKSSLATKDVWSLTMDDSGTAYFASQAVDLVVFLGQTETLNVVADVGCAITGSFRQVADSNGVLINPSGFTPQ